MNFFDIDDKGLMYCTIVVIVLCVLVLIIL
jgi:hypothetical protein